VVVPAERVVGAVSKHPDRFLDGERVTRDAHRRLLWRLLALGELRGNRDLLPGRDDRTAVAVVVLFGGWIVAFDASWSAGIVLTSVESMERSSRAGRGRRPARRGGRRPVDDVFEVGEEAIDRVSTAVDRSHTAEPDDRVLEFSRDWTDAVDVLVVAVQERSEECWWVMICVRPPASGANTSNSSRKSNSRCSNNASVSVAITLKNSSIEVSSCRMLALVDTVPTSCVFVCDAFYDTLLLLNRLA